MKYKAIIFDLYGTLVDSYSDRGYKRLLADMALALELPVEDFSKIWRDTTYERGIGIFKTIHDSIHFICEKLNAVVSEKNIKKCVQIRLENTRRALTPKKGAVDILHYLRRSGYKIGLITNCSFETPLIWKDTELCGLFDVTLFSASVGLKKPELQIYKLACEQLGVEPNECFYIGDGDSDELSGACQFGMDAVMIRDPNEVDPYRLVEVEWNGPRIERFSEILDFI